MLGMLLAAVLAAAPTVDGKLDEPCWTAAEWHSDFMRPGDDAARGPLSRSTAFAIVSDEHNLYVGVRCGE